MQGNKWAPSHDSAPGYMGLSNNSYSYRDPPPQGSTGGPMLGLMSIAQPDTPQPDVVSLPPTPIANKSPRSSTSGGAVRPMSSPRPASFSGTSTFSTHPYEDYAGRKRRTESIFSFEMGPSFSTTKQLEEIYSLDQSNRHKIQLNAKMDRGFFRADQDWACYRRNYFQVSSTFDVHGPTYALQGTEVPCLLRTAQDELIRIEFFSIGISARVSGNLDKRIDLVQHTPKRDKGPQLIPKPQPVRAGGNLHLASVGTNHQIATFERMQFKTATANNGKRRAAQQYYEIVIDLYANTAQNQEYRVATCSSAPLVVRGRSPGHYADSQPRYRHTSSTSSQPSLPTSAPTNDMGTYYYDYNHVAAAAAAAAASATPSGGPPPNPYNQHHPQTASSNNSYFQRPDTKPPVKGLPPQHSHNHSQSVISEQHQYYPSFYSRPPEHRGSSFSATSSAYPPYGTGPSPPTHPYDDYSSSYPSAADPPTTSSSHHTLHQHH